MKKYLVYAITLLFAALFSAPVMGQFVLSGELRPRAEYSHGYRTLALEDQDPSFFTSQRTRLNFKYKNTRLLTKLTLQDVRAWGSQPQLVSNEDYATSIHEAWAEVFFTEEFSLKAGRQEVIYDDHRMFGNVGWAQQARSHDMAIFKYEGDFKIHAALAYHQNTDRTNNLYLGPDAYKALQMVWFNKKWDNLNLSILFLNNGKSYVPIATGTEEVKYSQTIGPRVEYKTGDFKFSGNFYYQGGDDGTDNDLSAYEFALDANYMLNENFNLFAGYEMLSGTAYDETAKNKSFTPFYGTNHKFNGFMDFFYVGNHVNSVGLSDFHFGAKYTQGKFAAYAKLLTFSAAADIDASGDNYLGTELDLLCSYKHTKDVSFALGYSHLFASESMTTLKGVPATTTNATQNFGYFMIMLTPQFLNYSANNGGE